MDFNKQLSTLLQMPALPLTWDSILKECDRMENEYLHIRSEFQWTLDYKRFQVEAARGNRSAGLIALKAAIAAAPENADILGDYKNYVSKPSIVDNIVLIVSSKKNEAKAAQLAWEFDKNDIQYLIVSGSDTGSIQQIRALQVDAPDNFESTPKKVAAALAWIYENLGGKVGVLKISDEMSLLNAKKLKESMGRLAVGDTYAGVPMVMANFDRCAHWGKCQDLALNRRVYGRPVIRPWADGSAYFLGGGAVEKIVCSLMRFPGLFDGEFYEDKLIGDTLVFEGVSLAPLKDLAEIGLSATPAVKPLLTPMTPPAAAPMTAKPGWSLITGK